MLPGAVCATPAPGRVVSGPRSPRSTSCTGAAGALGAAAGEEHRSPSRRDPVATLPIELGHHIFVCGVLAPHEVAPMSAVSKGWNASISDPWIWRQLARRVTLVPHIAGASVPPAAHDDETGVLDATASWKTWVLAQDRRASFHGSYLGPWCATPPRLPAIQHAMSTKPLATTPPIQDRPPRPPSPDTNPDGDLSYTLGGTGVTESAQEEERAALYHALFSQSKGDELMFPDEVVIPLPHDGTIAVWTSKMVWTLDAHSGAFLWGRRKVGETGHGFVAEDGLMVLNRYIRKQGSHNLGVWKSEVRLGRPNARKGVYVSMGALPYSDIPSGLYGLQMRGTIVAALTGVGDVLFWDAENMRHYRTLDLVVFPRSLVRRPWSASYTFDDTYFFITEDARLGPEIFGAGEATTSLPRTDNQLTNIWAIHMDTNTVIWSLHHGALPFAEGMEDAFTIPPRASQWTISWPTGSSYGQARMGYLFPVLRNMTGARLGASPRKSLPGQAVWGNWDVLSCSSHTDGPGILVAAHGDRLLVMADYTSYFAAIRLYSDDSSHRPHAPHGASPVPRPVAEPDFPLSQPALLSILIPPADTSPTGLYAPPEDAMFQFCARAGGTGSTSPYFASGIWASSHPPMLVNLTAAAVAAMRGESRLDLIYVTDLAAARAPALIPGFDPILHPGGSVGAEGDGTSGSTTDGKGKGRALGSGRDSPLNVLEEEEDQDDIDSIESITELMGSAEIGTTTTRSQAAGLADCPQKAPVTAALAPEGLPATSAPSTSALSRTQAYRAKTSRALLVLLRNKFNLPAAVALTPSCAYVLYRSSGRVLLNAPVYGIGRGSGSSTSTGAPRFTRRAGGAVNPLGTPGSPRAAAALASASGSAAGGRDLLGARGLTSNTQVSSVLRIWDYAMSSMLALEPEAVAACLAPRGDGLRVSAPLGRGVGAGP